jgi:signal transduction histidine kinase
MGAQTNHILIYVILTYAFILLVFLFFFFHLRAYHKKIQQAQLESSRAELAQIEKERMNIATELHHDLSPQLASLRVLLNELECESNQQLILRGNQTIANAMDQIRRKIRQLSPIAFFQNNFQDALHYLIEQQRIVHPSLQIHLSNSSYFDLQQEAANHMYRILQEIILNTIKHANAQNLFIEFSTEKNLIIVRTADDGIGFRDEKNKKSAGFGLLSIQNRLNELGGVIVKNQHFKKGTQYHISLPRHWEKIPVDYFSKS